MSKIDRLRQLCGLESDELAEVLENNPRAYMAVKGAVAEKHLQKHFEGLSHQGKIESFRMAENDFEKDFYVTLNNGIEKVVECKNIEVLKVSTKKLLAGYLTFLNSEYGLLESIDNALIQDYKLVELKELFMTVPQKYRESGLIRYGYSESLVEKPSFSSGIMEIEFLQQFEVFPLTIDLQRTRNQITSNSKDDPKAGRYYRIDEMDVVAACLFSRTKRWEFVFGSRNALTIHGKFPNRYSNRLIIDKSKWSIDFLKVVGD